MDAFAVAQLGFAPALAAALLNSLWQVALLGVLAWIALAMLSRASASARHTVAMGFLLAMVVAPASTFLRFWQPEAMNVEGGWLPAITAPQIDAMAGGFVQQTNPVTVVLALLWLLGVGLMLLVRFGGWRVVSRLERLPFQPLSADWQRRVDELQRRLHIGRDVAVRLSADVLSPFTARLLRPVIWLPLSLITRLPREQVEALIAHELAHIARMDWLWNGLQCVVEALLFFHPVAWWLGRRIRAERELACDELAVAACGNAIALAEALVTLERGRHSLPLLVQAAQGGSLMNRITRLLNSPPSRGRSRAIAALGIVLTVGALATVQVVASGNWRPGLHVRSTTDGKLGPGDSREIRARGVGGDRYYRISIDKAGKQTEVYKLDGQVRPIDAGVRNWLAAVEKMGVPIPPPPPIPPMPPLPPEPPAPPNIAESAAFKSLVSQVAADPAVIAALGTPIRPTLEQISGRIEVGEGATPDGSADLTFDLRGPKGRSTVSVEAEMQDGVWSWDEIALNRPVR